MTTNTDFKAFYDIIKSFNFKNKQALVIKQEVLIQLE